MVNHHLGAVKLFAYVFVGLGGVVILSASGNGESREAQSGHEPQQHYDNLAAHGQGLRCLHCKYNNNVHTRKENRQESDGWGRKSYDAACCPRCGQMAQVDRFVADVVEKDTIHIHQRSLVVLTVMARVLSDGASVMIRVPELVADVTATVSLRKPIVKAAPTKI